MKVKLSIPVLVRSAVPCHFRCPCLSTYCFVGLSLGWPRFCLNCFMPNLRCDQKPVMAWVLDHNSVGFGVAALYRPIHMEMRYTCIRGMKTKCVELTCEESQTGILTRCTLTRVASQIILSCRNNSEEEGCSTTKFPPAATTRSRRNAQLSCMRQKSEARPCTHTRCTELSDQPKNRAAMQFPSATLRYSTRPAAQAQLLPVVPREVATQELQRMPNQSTKPSCLPIRTAAKNVLGKKINVCLNIC